MTLEPFLMGMSMAVDAIPDDETLMCTRDVCVQESAEEDALEQGKLHARIEELSMQMDANAQTHRADMEEKIAAITSLNGVVKVNMMRPFISFMLKLSLPTGLRSLLYKPLCMQYAHSSPHSTVQYMPTCSGAPPCEMDTGTEWLNGWQGSWQKAAASLACQSSITPPELLLRWAANYIQPLACRCLDQNVKS